ncbi:MAG TPA: SRPBCC domain-containing protein, partial [Hyphomicrobium sp.]|nr:SRPBCC domain-containing protein [Hyphomicrobium sp.]
MTSYEIGGAAGGQPTDVMFAEIVETATTLATVVAPVSVTIVRKFRSAPHRVYAAWTEAALLARWLVPDSDTVTSAISECRKGGQFRLAARHANGQPYVLSGRFVDLTQDRRVVLSWFYEGPSEALRSKLS